MYVIREIMNCKPGKVRPLMEKFRALSDAVEEVGGDGFRLLTDVSGEPFWTMVLETEVERVEDFFELEAQLMADDDVREAMAGYHDLVDSGRREIYRVES